MSSRVITMTVLALSAALALAQDVRDDFRLVTPENFDQGGAVSRQFHLHAESYRRTATIARTAEARVLTVSRRTDLADLDVQHRHGRSRFVDYVREDPLIDAVIVLHDGQVVFEEYRAMQPWQRHFAWSVSKVVASAALAALVHDGRVLPDEPVEIYVPMLRDTAWAGIPVSAVANMASGIDCLDDDGYQVKTTCIYRMEETLGITAPSGYEASFAEHLRSMTRHRSPGQRYEYVSANTQVIMLIVESVTGSPYARALQSLIWDRIGAEADALVAISDEGYAYASGGIIARLRDIARFGSLFVNPERFGVFDADIVRSMQTGGVVLDASLEDELRDTFGEDLPTRAGWQWDRIWEDGAMYKGGYLGQGLYVDPARDLVVAWFGTGLDFNEKRNDMLPVSRQLARSGLFARRPDGA